jgi:hypothetical protein
MADAAAEFKARMDGGRDFGVRTQPGFPGTIQAAVLSTVKTELELSEAADATAGFNPRVGVGAALGCAPTEEAEAPSQKTPIPDSDTRDQELNTTVSIYQAELADWKLRGLSLSGLASQLHDWADELWTQFVPAKWKGCTISKPGFFFVFDWEPSRILGHYHPGRNQAGIRWEISVNPANLPRLSEIQIASVVLHEQLHAFEDMVGAAPRSRNGYHSSWLRKHAGQLGIPCTQFGCTCGIRPESPFMDWARHRGLAGSPLLKLITAPVEQAKQKRQPWICQCPSGRAITVYAPTGSKLLARCESCGALFRPKGGLTRLAFTTPVPEAASSTEQFGCSDECI